MYREVTVSGNEYVIIHAGIDYDDFEEDKPLCQYKWDDMIWVETDYERTYFQNKTMVTGHTPVDLIKDGANCRIVKMNNHIAIDCACS